MIRIRPTIPFPARMQAVGSLLVGGGMIAFAVSAYTMTTTVPDGLPIGIFIGLVAVVVGALVLAFARKESNKAMTFVEEAITRHSAAWVASPVQPV
jgi:ABC-type Mn2+/Zn2+ transport system permease subunit